MKIFISAGERSGDEHGAALAKAIFRHHSDAKLYGIGGSEMAAAGVSLLDNLADSGIMGGFELFAGITKVVSAYQKTVAWVKEHRPQSLVLIDYPDFNFRLAKIAKSFGIQTVYFISPKLWLWRKGRIKLVKKYIDHMAVIFPFERDFYLSCGYTNVTYVGNPIIESTPYYDRASNAYKLEQQAFKAELGIAPHQQLIVIMPGSRKSELSYHMPIVHECCQLLKTYIQEAVPVLALPKGVDVSRYNINAIRLCGRTGELLKYGDVGLIKSGTSNLQAAAHNLPFVMFYRFSRLSGWLATMLVGAKYYSLVNIIRPNSIPEYLQDNASPIKLVEGLKALLSDPLPQKAAFKEIRQLLGSDSNSGSTVYERVATLVG